MVVGGVDDQTRKTIASLEGHREGETHQVVVKSHVCGHLIFFAKRPRSWGKANNPRCALFHEGKDCVPLTSRKGPLDHPSVL